MTRPIFFVIVTMALGSLAIAQPARASDSCGCAPAFSDPSVSPFAERAELAGAVPYKVTESNGKRSVTSLAGAVIYLRPVPGLTTELLQHALDQHRSYMASAGHAMPECPLSLENVSATAESTGNGFAVTLASKDPDTAKEILRRATALVAP